MTFGEPLPLLVVAEGPETVGMLAVLTEVYEVVAPRPWLTRPHDQRAVAWVTTAAELTDAAAAARLAELRRRGVPHLLVTVPTATGITWADVAELAAWAVSGPDTDGARPPR